MAAIYPLPTTRSSEALIHSRLLAQLQFDQLDLVRLQSQISTGRRILSPSDDAPAAVRAVSLQRLLEQKAQATTNLKTSQSYLAASDVAMSMLSGIVAGVRGTAVAVADSTASPSERKAALAEVDRVLQQILDVSNQQFRGRHLFAGTATTTRPFDRVDQFIRYAANEGLLSSYADLDLLFESNVPGSKLFGGLSAERQGSVDLNPILTERTRLAELNGGKGVSKGSIAVSDGTSIRIIDISKAETIGDVASLIERNPPAGRRVTARVTNQGLEIDIDDAGGGNLTIQEVGSGTTAAQLGIYNPTGTGTGPIIGRDLNPRLTLTTKLRDVLGTRATAVLSSPALNNDIFLEARESGAAFNNVRIQLVDDELLSAAPGLSAGAEAASYSATAVAARASVTWGDGPAGQNDIVITAAQPGTDFNNVQIVLARQTGLGANNPLATYDSAARRLTITLDDAVDTPIADIKNAIEGVTLGGVPLFTVADDNSAGGGNGSGSVSFLAPSGEVGNTGNSGGEANTIFVRIQRGQSTAQQVVNALTADTTIAAMFDVRVDSKDASSAGASGTGLVDISATAVTVGGSGVTFDQHAGLQIVNGGQTHTISFHGAETIEDLLNTLNGSQANVLAQINASGTGIDLRSRLSGSDFRIGENGGQTATQLGLRTFTLETQLADLRFGMGVHQAEGVDFTIRRNDGVELAIDIGSARTVGDVLNLINNHPANLDPDTRLVARLTPTGNGIELVDDNPQGTGQLTITRSILSEAAWDLGLIPRGQDSVTPGAGPPPSQATVTVAFDPPNSSNNSLVLTATHSGTQFNGVQVVFQNVAASGNQALVSYDATAKILTIDVDPLATTANTVSAAIQAEGTFSATLNAAQDVTNNGTGLIAQTGLLGVTAGGSSNPASLQASASVTFPTPNNINTALRLVAVQPGTLYNDVQIELIDDLAGNVASVAYDPGQKRLLIHVDATQTTAATIRTAINDHGVFYAELDRSTDLTNDGSGLVGTAGVVGTLSGGTPEILVGTDQMTLEASGIFNSLLRLRQALADNDPVGIQRAAQMLDADIERINFVRADLGAKSQAMDTLQYRIEDETVELKNTLSLEIDIDLVEAISSLTARQATYQASLQLMAKTFQLSLLDYL